MPINLGVMNSSNSIQELGLNEQRDRDHMCEPFLSFKIYIKKKKIKNITLAQINIVPLE